MPKKKGWEHREYDLDYSVASLNTLPIVVPGACRYLQTSEYHNAHPRQVNFTSGQVDFQLTCPDEQVEILEKY